MENQEDKLRLLFNEITAMLESKQEIESVGWCYPSI